MLFNALLGYLRRVSCFTLRSLGSLRRYLHSVSVLSEGGMLSMLFSFCLLLLCISLVNLAAPSDALTFEINPFISDKDPYFFYLRCRRFATCSFLDSAPLPEFGEK